MQRGSVDNGRVRLPLAAWRAIPAPLAQELRRRDLVRAAWLRKHGRYDESRRVILRASRRQPDDQWLRQLAQATHYAREEDRARTIFDEGRTEDAITAMQGLADRFPDDAGIHLWLASMYMTLENFEQMAVHVQHALDAEPDDPIVMFRAACRIRWSDTGRARVLLEDSKRGIAASSDLRGGAFRPDFDHLEGLIAHDEGNVEEAVRHLERAFRDEPNGIGHGADLAVAYLEQDRPRDALDVIARALEHHPGDGRLLRLQRQAQEAPDIG